MTFENMVARYRKISEHIEELKDMGLRYVASASLNVKRIPNDAELKQLRAEAESLARDE